MKHQTREQLQKVAEIHLEEAQPAAMTRSERLQRWAELLEQNPDRQLGTFAGTEYQPTETRLMMRSAGSAITVAFEDAVLRAEGLENDTYGEAKRFFELSDWQLHDIVCYCHFGETMKASTAARCVRAAMGGQFNLFSRLRHAVIG
jgi:hypothetical protein